MLNFSYENSWTFMIILHCIQGKVLLLWKSKLTIDRFVIHTEIAFEFEQFHHCVSEFEDSWVSWQNNHFFRATIRNESLASTSLRDIFILSAFNEFKKSFNGPYTKFSAAFVELRDNVDKTLHPIGAFYINIIVIFWSKVELKNSVN